MTGRRPLLVAGIAFVLLALVPAGASAQAWRAEHARILAEFKRLVERTRNDEAPMADPEVDRLLAEYLEKVVNPALRQARTCRQRMEAVELAIELERQAQLLGRTMDAANWHELLVGAYGEQMYERCMNELYRACIVEDNPMYTHTMAAWRIGWERQQQLLGRETGRPMERGRELDPRITRCRGPWYEVRITIERSGTEPDLGPWRDSDISHGWLGRGLGWSSRPEPGRHPGGFTRRAEQMSYGARCPDGDCPESCRFTAYIDGPAAVEYELEASHAYRMLSVMFVEEEDEKLSQNDCPHTEDLPIALFPGHQYIARFPADLVTPLTDDPTFPGGADPRVTEAMDEWPRMFQSKVVDLDDEFDRPLGKLEVLRVCDGQEIWSDGSSVCHQKWMEFQQYYRDLRMPELVPPWGRPATKREGDAAQEAR